MTAPKRMGLALGCVLLAVLSFGLIAMATSVRYGWSHVQPVLEILPVYLLFALPGWILALPFVLLFKDASGWRVWAILGIGSAIGPLFMLAVSLLSRHGHLDWEADGFGVGAAACIGTVTTVLYVVLLRRFAPRPMPGDR